MRLLVDLGKLLNFRLTAHANQVRETFLQVCLPFLTRLLCLPKVLWLPRLVLQQWLAQPETLLLHLLLLHLLLLHFLQLLYVEKLLNVQPPLQM